MSTSSRMDSSSLFIADLEIVIIIIIIGDGGAVSVGLRAVTPARWTTQETVQKIIQHINKTDASKSRTEAASKTSTRRSKYHVLQIRLSIAFYQQPYPSGRLADPMAIPRRNSAPGPHICQTPFTFSQCCEGHHER